MNPAAARRAELWIAGLVAATGVWGLILARDLAFTADQGARLADSVQFNPLGALLTIGLAVVAGAAAAAGAQRVVLAAGIAFAVYAVAVLVVLGTDSNWFGARGSNVSLLMGSAVGLVVLATAPRAPAGNP